MSTQYASGQEDDAAELTDSPGRRLRVARQTKGLELDRVAGELHLSKSMIKSLEHDDYDALPGQVFIVGYIRKYARVVGLDPEPLLASYHNAVPQTARTWLRPRATPRNARQVGSGHLIVRLASIAIAILLGGLAIVWWMNQPSEEEPESVETETEQEVTEAAAMPEAPPEQQPRTSAAAGASAPPDVLQPPSQPPQPPEPVPETPVQAAPEKQPPVESTAPATAATNDGDSSQEAVTETESAAASEDSGEGETTESGEILMTFDGPCWVDVRDSERKFKLFGEMKEGDSHVLQGTPPYSVILGNAAAVRITVDGEVFDLSTVSQGNVARFTLDPNESP